MSALGFVAGLSKAAFDQQDRDSHQKGRDVE